MANRKHGTLYIGVTSDLKKRVYGHKNHVFEGFTSKYNVHDLVCYEQYEDIQVAIQREKAMKFWKRKWKIDTIEKINPHWRDLCGDL
jgi:putative endonuclease